MWEDDGFLRIRGGEQWPPAPSSCPTTPSDEDAAAIIELQKIVDRQRARFSGEPLPDASGAAGAAWRAGRMLIGHRAADPGGAEQRLRRPPGAVYRPDRSARRPAGRAAYAAEQLGELDGRGPAPADPALFGSGRAFVRPQPKGVVGNIVPWNFPFDLSVGPLVEMLAAGNRVVIKPSDYTPACGELLREMIHADVRPRPGRCRRRRARAGPGVHARALGPPPVHRQPGDRARVARPPRSISCRSRSSWAASARRSSPRTASTPSRAAVLGTKAIKNGQMCISVDYCWCRGRGSRTSSTSPPATCRESMPGYCDSDSCTGIITNATWSGSSGLVEEARARGCDVDRWKRRRAPIRRPAAAAVAGDRPARRPCAHAGGDLRPDPARDRVRRRSTTRSPEINAGERPLALYVFAEDEAVAEDVLRRTTSGGACVNSARSRRAALAPLRRHRPERPGRHHGIEGFREFSNQRGVFVRGDDDLIDAFPPPYGATAQAIVEQAFAATA